MSVFSDCAHVEMCNMVACHLVIKFDSLPSHILVLDCEVKPASPVSKAFYYESMKVQICFKGTRLEALD